MKKLSAVLAIILAFDMRALLSALLMVLSTTAWADFQFSPATATAAPRFYF